MNLKQLSAVIDGITPVVRRFMAESISPLESRVKVLEHSSDQEVDIKSHVANLVEMRMVEMVRSIEIDRTKGVEDLAQELVSRFSEGRACG